jgi:hypothetical protein
MRGIVRLLLNQSRVGVIRVDVVDFVMDSVSKYLVSGPNG